MKVCAACKTDTHHCFGTVGVDGPPCLCTETPQCGLGRGRPLELVPGHLAAEQEAERRRREIWQRLPRTRDRILAYLAVHGPVTDHPSGRATRSLSEAVEWAGSFQGFSVAVVRLAEDGLLERDISGKRCFRIALTTEGYDAAAAAVGPRVGDEAEPARVPEPVPDETPRDVRPYVVHLTDRQSDLLAAAAFLDECTVDEMVQAAVDALLVEVAGESDVRQMARLRASRRGAG